MIWFFLVLFFEIYIYENSDFFEKLYEYICEYIYEYI